MSELSKERVKREKQVIVIVTARESRLWLQAHTLCMGFTFQTMNLAVAGLKLVSEGYTRIGNEHSTVSTFAGIKTTEPAIALLLVDPLGDDGSERDGWAPGGDRDIVVELPYTTSSTGWKRTGLNVRSGTARREVIADVDSFALGVRWCEPVTIGTVEEESEPNAKDLLRLCELVLGGVGVRGAATVEGVRVCEPRR
jgi:hypothetical protein